MILILDPQVLPETTGSQSVSEHGRPTPERGDPSDGPLWLKDSGSLAGSFPSLRWLPHNLLSWPLCFPPGSDLHQVGSGSSPSLPQHPLHASPPRYYPLLITCTSSPILESASWGTQSNTPASEPGRKKVKVKSLSHVGLCDPVDCSLCPCRLLRPWDSPGKNTGVGYCFLPQGIFSTQGSNLGLPHWRQTL